MLYQTIVLELLQEHPPIYDQLLTNRTLLTALEAHARELRMIHEAWQDRIWQAKPHSDARLITNETLEIALNELETRLLSPSPPEPLLPVCPDSTH